MSDSTVTVLHYPSCSTCRKARKWLDAQGIAHSLVHIVDETPSADELAALIDKSGLPLKRFFNTSGQSYRNGGWKEKVGGLDLAGAAAALAADGKLIKRPLVDLGDAVLVGFKEAEWQAAFGRQGA